MNQELTTSFKKVVKGTGVVFIGTILGTLLGFIFRVIVVRYITKAEYGLLSLSLAMINILVVVSCLGFINGVPRFISYALGKREYSKAWATIKTSISLVAVLSIFFALVLVSFSNYIANFFHKLGLIPIVKIIAFVLPLMALTEIFISILRGFEDVKAKVFFQDIFSKGIKIVIGGLVILLDLSFKGVVFTYLIGGFFTLIFLSYYAKSRINELLPKISNFYPSITKELMSFSLPLLGSSIFAILREHSTILLLGYFKPANTVGLYNVALPLAQLISMPLMAMVFIYLPIASQLYAQGNLKDMKLLYISVTKWIFFITLPIFLSMLLAPKIIIKLLFGSKYIEASVALQILTLGFFIHTFLGPNGMTLISIGKTNIMLFCSVISTFVGIIVALLLIPNYGLIGAAVSAATSLAMFNFSASFFLYKIFALHPFKKNYTIPLITTISLILLGFHITKHFLSSDWQIIISVLFLSICFPLITFLTKNFTEEDIWFITTVKKKMINNSHT
ncbi:polysaccharide biosynthesis protein [Candidatus Desulfofervidus auxilii]|uniref:Polysaccharide biosynthesis protein n=1 Tax=Desulfofervidus auxilii TaxID=1621989 RepID=A0A7U4QLA5_DESA2|nr:flippase [Candidatus Desulfofervidus auxilii]AMM41428.1 polysaccharide biosynthesis protein [Candidatus Desulfofervidus auxilii]